MSYTEFKELEPKQQDVIRALLKDNAFNHEFLVTTLQEYLITNNLLKDNQIFYKIKS